MWCERYGALAFYFVSDCHLVPLEIDVCPFENLHLATTGTSEEERLIEGPENWIGDLTYVSKPKVELLFL